VCCSVSLTFPLRRYGVAGLLIFSGLLLLCVIKASVCILQYYCLEDDFGLSC
jgi:hypothetical protein